MGNDIERLKWLISLSEKDLSGVTEWEWPTLKAELIRYLSPWADPKYVGLLLRLDNEKELSKKEFREDAMAEIQAELRTVLKDLVTGSVRVSGLPPRHGLIYQSEIPLNVTLKILQTDTNKEEKFEFRCYYDGPLRDRVFITLSNILAAGSVTPTQLRRCPQCERIFLLARKPDPKKKYFCSPKCSSKASSRDYYQRIKNEGAERFKAKRQETSHRHYVGKQQKTHGSKTKVARRPRKQR